MTRRVISDEGPGRIVDIYNQIGQNENFIAFGQGTNVTVNAAATLILGWTYTPPIDVWAEFEMFMALTQKTDAAYHYAYPSLVCGPAPVAPGMGATINGPYITQHSQVQQFEGYQSRALWALTAGVAYVMRGNWNISGGTWQYHQGATTLRCLGKSWAR